MIQFSTGLIVGLLVLALVLWWDRRLLTQATFKWRVNLPMLILLLVVAVLMGGATWLTNGEWTKIAPNGDGGASERLTLVLTALGIFIALVTSISLAVSKDAIEAARKAKEEIGLSTLQKLNLAEVANSMQMMLVSTHTLLIRSSVFSSQLKVNVAPLLEEKLKLIDEMLRFQRADFDGQVLAEKAYVLLDFMDNLAYKGHLNQLFGENDRRAVEHLIDWLRRPDRGNSEVAVAALVKLLRRLQEL